MGFIVAVVNLTIETLRQIKASIPKASSWHWCVSKPEFVERLKAETKLVGHLGHTLALGIEVFPKQQVAHCWMFADLDTLKKYLRDELTELDLIEIALTGTCAQQSFSE